MGWNSEWPTDFAALIAALRWELHGRPAVGDTRPFGPPAVELASWHGVLPTFVAFSAALPQPPSPDVVAQLAAASRRHKIGALQRVSGLRRVLAALSDAGVETLVLKGVPLSARLYGDPLLRPGNDLDLLVRPADLVTAVQALTRLGASIGAAFCADPIPTLRERVDALELMMPDGLEIDLHWRLAPKHVERELDTAAVWRRRSALTVVGCELYTLSGPDQLRFLVRHGAKHAYCRLRWLADVAQLLPQLEAQALLDLMVVENVRWSYTRHLLCELFGLDLRRTAGVSGLRPSVQALVAVTRRVYRLRDPRLLMPAEAVLVDLLGHSDVALQLKTLARWLVVPGGDLRRMRRRLRHLPDLARTIAELVFPDQYP